MPEQYSDLPEGATPVAPASQPSSQPSQEQYSDLPEGAQVVSAPSAPQQPTQAQPATKAGPGGVVGFLNDMSEGVGAGAGKMVLGLADQGAKVAEKVGDWTGTRPTVDKNVAMLRNVENKVQPRMAESENASIFTAKGLGYGTEKLYEFMMLDGAFRSLSLGEKAANVAKGIKFFEKNPGLYKAFQAALSKPHEEKQALTLLQKFGASAISRVAEALELGTVGTAQQLANGQSVGESVKTGAETGVAGAAVGGALEAAGSAGKGLSKILKEGGEARGRLGEVAEKGAAFAEEPKAIADRTSAWLEDRHDLMHQRYQKGVDTIKDMVPGKAPYKDTEFYGQVEKEMNDGKIADPFSKAEKKASPVTPEARKLIEDYHTIGNPEVKEGEPAPPIPSMDIESLMQRRSSLAGLQRKMFKGGKPEDGMMYGRLIESIDDSIQKLAQSPDANPAAVNAYKSIRGEYKESIKLFNNPAVKALQEGNLNDVSDKLLRGDKSIENIQAVRSLIGDDKMSQLASDIARQQAAHANGDPSKLVDWWSSINKGGRKQQVLDELFKISPPKSPTEYYQDAIKELHPGLKATDLASGDLSKVMQRANELEQTAKARASTLTDIGAVIEDAQKSANVQRMFKVLGLGTSVGSLAELGLHGHPIMALLGYSILASGKVGSEKLVEYVADHPYTWKALGLLSKVSGGAGTAASVGGSAVGKLTAAEVSNQSIPNRTHREVMSGASPLAGNQ